MQIDLTDRLQRNLDTGNAIFLNVSIFTTKIPFKNLTTLVN